MSELGRFQDAFSQALRGDVAALRPWTAGRTSGEAEACLAVYRNTTAKGCADALAAQFPTVARALGEARMRAAALAFAREHPPATPSLMAYGAGFPEWLAAFPPTAGTPWAAGLARVDWARAVVLFAPDQAPLGAEAFAALAPDALAATTAELHPATALLWFEDATPSLWAQLQGDDAPAEAELAPEPQGLLLLRPHLEAAHRILGPGTYAFLQACGAGLSLAAAGEAALLAEPDLALGPVFADLISAGAFAGVAPCAALGS
ncbi:MAG TPA: DNA-binding domain-containing protein [Phenylobacterium sp.]|nr:DNA-binding domain-containing protein [Phenylobacterium sp.]